MAQTRTGNGETAEPATEQSRKELHHAADRLAARAHQTIDKAAGAASGAEGQIRRAAARAAVRARALEGQAKDSADRNMRKLRTYIEHNPLTSAGLAFAAGVLLSKLLRR
jgi:ElaB/YqjD/DUF883 family membrane-anchored ribosome-binding protein